MKDQLQTIREFVESQRHVGRTKALTALAQIEKMVGEPVASLMTNIQSGDVELVWNDDGFDRAMWHEAPLYRAAPVAQQYEAGDVASAAAQGFRDGVASVAQQQEPVAWAMPKGDGTFIDVITPAEHAREEGSYTVPLFAHPAAQQPQAEAVPAVDRVYEAAKRLVDHADFQLGGVLSDKSKTRDIPSNAASKVKARHLASLRDALAKAPQQAEAVPSDVGFIGGLVAIKTLLQRDPCVHANVAIQMLDAAIAQQKGGDT